MNESFEGKHFKEEFHEVFSGAKTLQDVLDIVNASQIITGVEKKTALHVIDILRSRVPEEQRIYLGSEGYKILAGRLPHGFDEKIQELIGGAQKREAHDFGDSSHVRDFDK